MRTKLFLMLFALLVMAGTSYAHDLEPLHVDGRYLKNPNGDIVTLHGWITGWEDLYGGYYEYTDYEARFAAWKLTTDSILAAGYKLDYARLHFGGDWGLNPDDFDSFVQRGDFEKGFLPMVDYLNSKGIYVLLMANVRADGDSDVRTIGDSWHQRLMKYWQLVSTHPRIKNNPGVMFELANEPMEFMDSDGSKNNFKTMKNYFQPIADLIRRNGCQQVIWVPGWGCQNNYNGYAVYPIEGDNIGYAVHAYCWWDEDSKYEFVKERWNQQIKLASNMAPIIVTETMWDNNNNDALFGTSTFGKAFKRISDEYGNVSWNLICNGYDMCRVNQPSPDGKPTIYNDPEACYVPCLQWFEDYSKTKITSISQLKADKVELVDVHTTACPGDTRPITLMAAFSDGRQWNVAGDAVWTSSDESVISVKQGNMHVKKEGTVTIHGKYTDGTGKVFDVEFSVLSSLFPLTASGVRSEYVFGAAYDENTHTFSGLGNSGWYYPASLGDVMQKPSWNYIGGIDMSAYKYLVIRLNDYPTGAAELRLSDKIDEEPEIKVNLQEKKEVVLDLHAYQEFDLNHITSVTIWQDEGSKLNVKEIFLSNDGVNPALPYMVNTVVTACDVTMYYGDDVPELSYTVIGGANIGTPKLTTTATKTSPVGTYDILISGNADGVTYKPGKLTVVPAPLTITANDAVVGKGKEIPALTLSYDGLRNGETAAEALSEMPTVTTTATKDSPIGNYEIIVSGGKSANYELAWHNGTLTITPDATISLPADRTARVETSTEAWDAWGVCSTEFAPAVTTADGRTVQMVECYDGGTVATTGKVMEQTVTGLETGEYTVVLCANAYYTDGRGFDSDLKEGATDIVELYANDVRQPMIAHIGPSTSKNDTYTLKNVKVVDGSLTIGMEALKAGTNWHTLQIKSLTLTKLMSLSEAYSLALVEAKELLPQRMSEHARNTLQQAIALEQTYANYYRMTDAIHQARKSIDAQAFAARALEVMKNELLNATNVCTPEGKEVFQQCYQAFNMAYDEEFLTDKMVTENFYNPLYAGFVGLAYWKLVEFMMSSWEYNVNNTPYMQGAPYSVNGGVKADDGTGFNLPCIEYFLEEGKQRLVARTLKATMTDMEPGQYTVTARVRLRLMDGASGAPKGVTLQVCDGTAVNISGQRIGDTNEYLDCYTATGTVGSDGVLTIKFHVAADNNLSNLAFRDLWQEKGGPVTITANSVEITYGDEVPALTYTSAGDAVSGVPALTVTATSTSPAGTYPIVVEQGTVERKNVSYVAGTLTIKPAPLTITADNKTKKQGEAMPELTATYKGFKNDETAEVLTKQPTLSCTATAASAPGTYPITVKGATAQNYDISFVNGTLTVTDADAVTVTANSYTIEYGDALPEFAYTAEGAELNGKPRVSCSAKQGSPVGTYDIVITKGSVKNYNDTYVNGTLTITKAPLTVGVKDETITEGDAIPAFTLTYDGFKNNDTEASAFTKKPVASTTATSKSEAGTYPITVSGGEARNYALTYGQGTLVIEAPSVPKDVDLTDRVGTSQSDWNAGGVCATEYAPAITTSDGRQAQMMETYEETVETTGEMMYQVITGLENGDYAVELYANAQYTDGRGFDSNLTDGARKVVYVSANDRRCYVTAHIGTAVSRNSICTVYTQVKDGTLRLGLTAEQPGTNWHTLQIKKLTLLRHGTVIYADDKTREEGTANPQWTYTVSGTAVTGKPTLSCTAGMYASPGCWIINVGKGTVKSDQPIYLQPGVLTITIPVGIGQVSADEQSEPIYDLQGRRVDATVLRKGLYIRGGKVIILGK